MHATSDAAETSAARAPEAPRPPPLFLRVAITGHREARRLNEGAARRGLAQAFDACAGVLETARRTSAGAFARDEAELVLISALAEGADQIAVDVFRSRAVPAGVIAHVEAVIPFPVEGYATTMTTEAARDALRDMAATARACIILADGSPDPAKEEDPLELHWRNQRYAIVGDILIRQADVLVAVWDGTPSTATGGTASVILGAMRERLPVLWAHATTGEVRLLTPDGVHGDLLGGVLRAGGSLQLETAGAEAQFRAALSPLLAPVFHDDAGADPHDLDAYARSRDSYRRFFDEGGKIAPPRSRTRATAYNRLLWWAGAYVVAATATDKAAGHSAHLPRRAWPRDKWPGWTIPCLYPPKPVEEDYLDSWGGNRLRENIALPWIAFDTIATRLGHIYRSSYVITFAFAALAVLVALIGQFFPDHETFLAILEWGALATAAGSFLLSRYFRVHDRWVLARGMEGQFRAAWNLAQLGLAGRRTPKGRDAPWAEWAVQAWVGGVGAPAIETTSPYLARLAEYLRQTAVADQIAYHRSNADRLHMLHHTLETVGKGVFILAPWAGVFAVLHHHYPPIPAVATEWVLFFGAGMPAVAAAVAGLRYQGDFLRFATRSQRTARDLGAIDAALTRFAQRAGEPEMAGEAKRNDFAELRDILVSLESILSADLQDWRYVYSARPNPEP
ncbi:MAG TPA: hypothetical protein PKA55_17070 [Rhodoblastus sp.]|nr:hypothetical protein [Rhodoblastus sp.]